MEMTLDCPSRI